MRMGLAGVGRIGAFHAATLGRFHRDCSIHDFDVARFVTGREVVSVFAVGHNRGAAVFAGPDDIDPAAAVLTMTTPRSC